MNPVIASNGNACARFAHNLTGYLWLQTPPQPVGFNLYQPQPHIINSGIVGGHSGYYFIPTSCESHVLEQQRKPLHVRLHRSNSRSSLRMTVYLFYSDTQMKCQSGKRRPGNAIVKLNLYSSQCIECDTRKKCASWNPKKSRNPLHHMCGIESNWKTLIQRTNLEARQFVGHDIKLFYTDWNGARHDLDFEFNQYSDPTTSSSLYIMWKVT